MRWAVVVPTNRPKIFAEFYRAWEELFDKHNALLVVMQDNDTDYEELKGLMDDRHLLLNWSDIDSDTIPRRTDMVRSWAFYRIWKDNLADWTMTLDDDVRPIGDIFEEYAKVFQSGAVMSEFFDVGALTDSGLNMRGFPYKDRTKQPVFVQYGGWSGVLDYDAATQLAVPKGKRGFKDVNIALPLGSAVTACIMNTAFQTAVTPIMWQLPMLDGRYNRVGDIWSGLFIKKVLDEHGYPFVINGKATVLHDRASDPYNSLIKEAPSVYINDHLWENLFSVKGDSMIETYREVTDSAVEFFTEHDPEYATHFKKARDEWLKLFQS